MIITNLIFILDGKFPDLVMSFNPSNIRKTKKLSNLGEDFIPDSHIDLKGYWVMNPLLKEEIIAFYHSICYTCKEPMVKMNDPIWMNISKMPFRKKIKASPQKCHI